MQWISYIRLVRPANIITAISDIVAGVAISGSLGMVGWNNEILIDFISLILATSCLYAGGIVFNDVFDIEHDQVHRPERVIPSGKVSLKKAKTFGVLLFIIGVISAFVVSPLSGSIAIGIALLALLYDKYSKHQAFLGPLNMGLCRGGNLVLGISIMDNFYLPYLWIGILPIIFISAITLTAQKETQGKNKMAIVLAMLLDISIVIGFVLLSKFFDFSLKTAFIFILLWYVVNFSTKLNAVLKNRPKMIQRAVKAGILSLIPLNASYVAGFSTIYLAIATLSLLPISLYLSKKFAVT